MAEFERRDQQARDRGADQLLEHYVRQLLRDADRARRPSPPRVGEPLVEPPPSRNSLPDTFPPTAQ